MDRKKAIVNFILAIILIILIIIICVFYKKYDENRKKEEANNVILTEIRYGSEVEKFGYINANGIINNFIDAYNEHSGSRIAAMMDFIAKYIYALSQNENVDFDQKYVEILSNPSEYDELYVMEYSVKQEEKGFISFIDDTNVELVLVENSQIQDISKYLSKFNAKIRTISNDEGIDQVDILEFLLVHKDDAYYVMDYYPVDENGNKIDSSISE